MAHEALVRHGAPPELADLVHDAIRLHLDLTTGDDHRPEVAGIHLGSAADVLGLRLDEIPAPTIELILKTHPAEGLAPSCTTPSLAKPSTNPTAPPPY